MANPFDALANDQIQLNKHGASVGTFKAQVSKDTILTQAKGVRFEPGDHIIRMLPRTGPGGFEDFWVVEAHYLQGPKGLGAADLSHWEIKVTKTDPATVPPPTVQPAPQITVTDSQNVQIGNQNTQTIGVALEELVALINSADATKQEKEEAKGMLRKLLEHPVVVSVLGSAVGAAIGLLGS